MQRRVNKKQKKDRLPVRKIDSLNSGTDSYLLDEKETKEKPKVENFSIAGQSVFFVTYIIVGLIIFLVNKKQKKDRLPVRKIDSLNSGTDTYLLDEKETKQKLKVENFSIAGQSVFFVTYIIVGLIIFLVIAFYR